MQHHSDHLILGYSLCTVAIACLLALGISCALTYMYSNTVCVKKINTATLPYLTFTFTYLLLPYPTLPLHTHTATLGYPTATFLYPTTTACCCVNSAAVAVHALNEYDYSYINVLLFKAHCLPRVVQCRFVIGLCRGIYRAL